MSLTFVHSSVEVLLIQLEAILDSSVLRIDEVEDETVAGGNVNEFINFTRRMEKNTNRI
jgi:hypothetical protein